MSKNRNVRNAKRIRNHKRIHTTSHHEVPLQRSYLKVGEVVQYNDWLFALTSGGVLVTDFGCGIDFLRHHYIKYNPTDHKHWFKLHRVVTRRPDLKL